MGISRHWLPVIARFWQDASTHRLPDALKADSDATDHYWMQQALQQADRARALGEVPVGAVLVKQDVCIAVGYNQPIARHDPTAHAEVVVLRAAGTRLKNYRLTDTTLYVTLEPCAMCMTALVHARIRRVVFGADDPARGAVVSALRLADADFLNHRVAYRGGVMAEPCRQVLKSFFRARRG